MSADKDLLFQLYEIQSQNPPSTVRLTDADVIYDIDLATRKITAPEFVSVSKDHKSETVYFRVKRYQDYMDLSNTICIVQYVTPDKKTYFYDVPFYDVLAERGNIIFPWCVDHTATRIGGEIEFSVRFFLVNKEVVSVTDYIDVEDATENTVEVQYSMAYNLETLPAKTKILNGMELSEDISKPFEEIPGVVERILSEVRDVQRYQGVTWTIYE